MIYKARNEYDVELNDFGADGGADIVFKNKVTKDNVAILQCKAFSKKQIGVNLIRELLGSMQDFKVKNGLFLATTSYSQAAKEFAQSHNITLFATSDIFDVYTKLPELDKKEIAQRILSSDFTTHTCVNCGIKMKESVSKTGKALWKCPKCRNTILRKAKTSKPASSPPLGRLINHIVSMVTRKVGFQIASFFLFILLAVFLLIGFPKLVGSVFKNISAPSTPQPQSSQPSAHQPRPESNHRAQPNEAEVKPKYIYMVQLQNGTNEIVDEYSSTGDVVRYKKGSLDVSLSKSDVKQIQRILVK